MSPQSQSGRIAVVTGANKGIGYFIAQQLGNASVGIDRLVLGCRDAQRAEGAVASLRGEVPEHVEVEALPLTIGDNKSHKEFAQAVQAKYGKVDVLVNNAGIYMINGREQLKPTLKINYRGTVHFTEGMIPLLRRGSDPRVVNVSSMLGRLSQVSEGLQDQFASPTATIEDVDRLVDQYQDYTEKRTQRQHGWSSSPYGISKLAVIAATRIWARREEGTIKFYSCCPGYCDTDMTNHGGTRHPRDGARNAVIPVTDANAPTGAHYSDFRVARW